LKKKKLKKKKSYFEEEKAIYFFGGLDGFENPQNDLFKFDLKSETFEKVQTKGNPPKPRYGHTTTLVNGNELYIIGGTNGSSYFNDIYIFDLHTKQYHNVDYKGNFIARAHHTTVLYEMNLFIFGGGNDKKIFNDIQCIDVVQMKNQQIQPTSSKNSIKFLIFMILKRWNFTNTKNESYIRSYWK